MQCMLLVEEIRQHANKDRLDADGERLDEGLGAPRKSAQVHHAPPYQLCGMGA